MFNIMTEKEIEERNKRWSFLYTSKFTVDNLTAILMDTSKGDLGLYEETARSKAHAILSWLGDITGVSIPESE